MKKIFFLIIFMIYGLTCMGQQSIKLNDVTKFELATHAGGLSNNYRQIEVVPDDDGWKCYQTRFRGYDSKKKQLVEDSSVTFIKNVPASMLNQLLDIISKQDTALNIDLFKISTADLISNIDSLKEHIQPQQKAEFIKMLQSENVVQKAFNAVIHPWKLDDKTYYGITITTKAKASFTIKAYSFADLYDLPWHINNIESYDPNISIIFAFMSGYDSYPSFEKRELYLRMDRNIYREYLKSIKYTK